MKRVTPGGLAAFAAATLLSFAAHAARTLDAPVAQGSESAEPETQSASALPATLSSVRVRASSRRVVTLDAPPASTKLFDNGAKDGTPLKVGFARAVDALSDPAGFAKQLAWESLEDGGQVAALSVTSPAAAALRMGLRVQSLPASAMLRFYAPGHAPLDVPAADVLKTIAINTQSGVAGDAARTYWSPLIEGDTIALEIEIPAHVAASEVRLSVPSVSHLQTTAASSFALPKATTAACELDAMCYTSQWGNEINAEARIIFTDTGSSYVCSATLLADKDTTTSIPYLLSANHCVTNQAIASTVQSYWFYNSTSCDSGTRSSQFRAIAPGATLLYASATTDTSLMQLTSVPPEGTGFAGWNVSASPAAGSSVTGIHHPHGDYTRISFGSIKAYSVCTASGDESFTCNGAASGSSTFYAINWASGITEQGSSGSGLFLNNGKYLIGQLYGGTNTSATACDASGTDWFGRFDIAYSNGNLGQWLAASGNSSSGPVPAFDYSDLWWNPTESGWGLSLIQHSATHQLYGTWYVYDAGGAPIWLVMPGGQWSSSTSFTGDLYSTTGPDPRGTFNSSEVTRTKVGSATLSFSSSTAGTLTWTAFGSSGSRSIIRQSFGVPDATSATNYQDLWWNASESGWGLTINQQYRTLFAVWYAYGTDGHPVWYVVPGGSWTSANTYSGTVYRTTSAPSALLEGGRFNASGVSRNAVGTMALTFTGSSSATMGFSIDGVSGTKSITRQPF